MGRLKAKIAKLKNWAQRIVIFSSMENSFSVALRRAKIIRTHRHTNVYSFHPQQEIAIARPLR